MELSEDGQNNLWNQVNTLWIEPELNRRKEAGTLAANFKIRHCLIRLPVEALPIVEFNDEIKWEVLAKLPSGREVTKDQAIYIHDIEKIASVKPPEVDGKRVAFIFVYMSGGGFRILFDSTPNLPEYSTDQQNEEKWDLGKHVAEYLEYLLAERTILAHEALEDILRQLGLWLAPSILPYPLSEIVYHLNQGNEQEARDLLVRYCNDAFLMDLLHNWWMLPEYELRRGMMEDALEAHLQGRYTLSIHALLPQLEGIVTEWALRELPEKEVPWKQESKNKKVQDLILQNPPPTFVVRKIIDSVFNFIEAGPVLASFKKWSDEINIAFPNRHAVLHGKFDASFFTKENSIKIFLLLDTLFHILISHEERRKR